MRGARKYISRTYVEHVKNVHCKNLNSLLLTCRVFVGVGSAGKQGQQDLDLQCC